MGLTEDVRADDTPAFLAGGGEMGGHIRAHDWEATPLGHPRTWPQPLKTAVRLLLSTGHPMFLWWGPELIQFYNDAYSHSIGPERHPGALGQRGADCWAEIWPIIGPQIEQVMAGGPATWHENQLVPITRYGRLEEVYWTYSYGPVDDPSAPSGVGGVLVVCTETTQQVLAERERAAEASRWHAIFEQAPSFICIARGPEHVFEYVNAAHREQFNSADWVGRPVREAFPEIADQGFVEALDRVLATGERFVFTDQPVRYRPSDDAAAVLRYFNFTYAPLTDAAGRPNGVFCEGFDVSGAHHTAEDLRRSEERLRLATEAAEIGFWDLDAVTGELTCQPLVKALFGFPADGPMTLQDFHAAVHPADREATGAAFAAALSPTAQALYDVEYRVLLPDGQVRWVAAKGRGRFGEDGVCQRVIGTAIDITPRKTAEEHLRLMVNELNHRVKNSLATVQAITSLTLAGDAIPAAVRDTLTARLIALAAAHDVLTDEKWAGAALREIAAQAAAPYGPVGYEGELALDGEPRFVLSGPPVLLPPKTAIALALAFHELATNAAKYGALSVPGGQVRIAWAAQPIDTEEERDPHRLTLEWREAGGPRVTPPRAAGFGSRLIEKGLAAELHGTVRIAYPPEGVVCTMDVVVG